jgi:hypothetical protein
MKHILPPKRDGERGATAVIVVLSLVAIFGLIVLTVDVGQLLFKRRAMVNASDAAALAAAQSCAGIADTDVPQAVANIYAQNNVSVATGSITEMVGCDGPAFGHVSVEYGMDQSLFFAGVLGFNGPARVATVATAGWGPTGGGHPVPIVVYEGSTQGGCNIQENTPPGVQCYMWYDNDLFANSAFGFLNLCTALDPCQQGWDIGASDTCPNVGSSLRDEWISGTWQGNSTETNYPDPTFVCRVGGLSSSDWAGLEARAGGTHVEGEEDEHDLLFPVNDCMTEVDKDGTPLRCSTTQAPDKYNIIGFIVLHLDAVYDSPAEWGGTPFTHCRRQNFNVAPGQTYPIATVNGGGCPSPNTPSGVQNFMVNGQASGANWTYDALNKQFTWTGPADRVTLDFDWWIDGQCGPPPNNSSAICLKVTTVEARFRGTSVCESCKDFGPRAVRLCDLDIGSCPQDRS